MYTIIIIFLLTVSSISLLYLIYGKYRKEKSEKDPSTYIDGIKALLDGKEEYAFTKFREVVSEDADNIDAYLRIGDILRKYGKADKALQLHQDLTIRHNLTFEQKKSILEALALDFKELGNIDSAATALIELIAMDDSNRRASEGLMDIYSHKGDWEEAYKIKESLVKMDGNKSKSGLAIYRFLQGEKLAEEKEYHKARLTFKEAINIDSACTPAYLAIGDSYLAENRLDDAIAIWRKMIKQIPAESHLVLGRLKKALYDVGKFGEISAICEEILTAGSKNLEARLTLADYYYKKGDNSLAVEHLNTAMDNYPASNLPILQLAHLYLLTDEKKKLGDLLNKLEERCELVEGQYHCKRCGYKFKNKKWLCPSCKAVDSFEK